MTEPATEPATIENKTLYLQMAGRGLRPFGFNDIGTKGMKSEQEIKNEIQRLQVSLTALNNKILETNAQIRAFEWALGN